MSINQISTKVCIIGAGPAGLLIANILQKYGIPYVVVEKYSQEEIYARSRAGLVDNKTINILQKYNLCDRLLAAGKLHDQCEFRTPDRSFVLNYAAMSDGQTHYTYPQQQLLIDLIAKLQHSGGRILFNTEGTTVTNDQDCAKVECQYQGQKITINCDFIAGCDGFHGVSRPAIAESILNPRSRDYDYAWLAITAEAPPSTEHIIYGVHPRGFAGHMLRTETISRYYLQIPLGDTAADWSSDRIWSELQLRLAKDSWTLSEGKIIAKQVLKMRSFATEVMQDRRLFLAGDAAHILTPAGGKGMNLAVQDADVLGTAFVNFYRYQDNLPLKNYSKNRLPEISQTQEFSESLLHMINVQTGNSASARSMQELQEFKLSQLMDSQVYGITFARNYVGYVRNDYQSSKKVQSYNKVLMPAKVQENHQAKLLPIS